MLAPGLDESLSCDRLVAGARPNRRAFAARAAAAAARAPRRARRRVPPPPTRAAAAAPAAAAAAGAPPAFCGDWPGSTMRSPSRSAPAPVVMIFSPSVRPDATSTSSVVVTPCSIARNFASCPSAGRNTPRLPPRSTTAFAGTTSVFSRLSTVKLTLAYMPGFSRKLGFGISISICAVRVAGSRIGAMCDDAPVEFLARDTRRPRRRPARPELNAPQVLLDDVGDQPDGADVDERDERGVGRHPGARVERARGDEAVHRRGDGRVRQVDLELVEPRPALRSSCACARSTCASAA